MAVSVCDLAKAKAVEMAKGSSLEERKKRLQQLKKTTKCTACGQKGHWAMDLECPKKAIRPEGHLAHAPVGGDSDSDDDEGYSFGVVDLAGSASSSGAAYVAAALMANKPKSPLVVPPVPPVKPAPAKKPLPPPTATQKAPSCLRSRVTHGGRPDIPAAPSGSFGSSLERGECFKRGPFRGQRL